MYLSSLYKADSILRNVDKEWTTAGPEKRKKESFFNDLQKIRKLALAYKRELQLAYIENNPKSFFSLIALNDLIGEPPLIDVFDRYYDILDESIKKYPLSSVLKDKVEKYRAISIGAKAIDFSLPDTSNVMIRLSDFRGKYVLIDFWASWCAPCRAENPKLLSIFRKYKDKNFIILGVSLDNRGKKETGKVP